MTSSSSFSARSWVATRRRLPARVYRSQKRLSTGWKAAFLLLLLLRSIAATANFCSGMFRGLELGCETMRGSDVVGIL